MPSPKQLAKALAYRGEIRNTPQNSFLGGVANFLSPVSEFADQYKISDRIPFLGGMSAADLTGLKGAQSLVNDMSYGKSPISGASLQTAKVDPRVLDLAGVSGAMMPVGKALGKAALREGARQIETGTGIGRAALNPRMSAVPEGASMPQRPKTEFEILHDTAQRNAALPVEQGGLGLPANNTYIDRANAPGMFPTDAYHATNVEFDSFDPSKTKFVNGVFSSTDPSGASAYVEAKNAGLPTKHEGGFVMPLRINNEKSVTPEYFNLNNIRSGLAEGNNVVGGDVVVIPDAKNIRSRFAAFDPFRRHEADILAGVGVGGMLDPQAIAEALRQQDRK